MAFLSAVVLVAGCTSSKPEDSGTEEFRSAISVEPTREKGMQEATAAIAAGKLLWKEYPPIPYPGWQGEYVALLKNRCSVDYQVMTLPDGVEQADFMEEIRGWDEVMQAEIERKHGAGIMGQLMTEAEEQWRK
jgi:hypothetical protein